MHTPSKESLCSVAPKLVGLSPRRLLKLGMPTVAKLRCQQATLRPQFEKIIYDSLRPHHAVLDAGCGTWTYPVLRGKVRIVVGVDADKQISNNSGVDSLVLADLSRLPFRDKTFDVVMSRMVVEHLDNPQACFTEFARICKDGALVVLATPNLLHYGPLMTALTPFGLHKWFCQHVLGSQGQPFPVRYRANTTRKLRKMLESAGFTTVEVRLIDTGAEYLRWLTPLYAAGLAYHRGVNRFDKLSCFRSTIIGTFRR